VLLSFHLISSSAVADQGVNLCTKTSYNTLKACNYGVKDDYWLAIAKCDNLPTSEERKACSQSAKEEKKSGAELCQAQFEARQVGK